MNLEKKDTLTTVGSGGSQDDSSPTSSHINPDSFFAKAAETPKKVATAFKSIGLFTPKQGKLKDEFGIHGRPSPPKNSDGTIVEMEKANAESRMNSLGFVAAMLPADWCGKLCWIIGKGLDKVILQRERDVLRQFLGCSIPALAWVSDSTLSTTVTGTTSLAQKISLILSSS